MKPGVLLLVAAEIWVSVPWKGAEAAAGRARRSAAEVMVTVRKHGVARDS